MTESTNQPLLSGLRVVDMTEALAGPYCTMYLGDMGADVVKIERRGVGDQTRGWGPPFVNGESAYFMSTNRNKRSLTLDITTTEGQAILQRMVDGADIFVNNLPRFSSMQKLGLDPDACLARNPRLIHVCVTSFGHTGPRAGQPGYDILSQGMSGIMSLTGAPDGEPMRYPVPISDMTVGLYALIGILAALYERERTGCGQAIDAAILESQMGWLTNLAGSYFATGANPPRMGNIHPTITPYQPFPTADGWIIIAGGTDRIWSRLCDMLGIPPQVRDDPRYATNPQRNVHRAEVQAMLIERFQTQPKAYWLERLREADVPSGPIYLLGEALADPQVIARDFIVELEHPVAGLVRSLGFPPHLRGGAISYRLAPPTLGQHSDEVLQEFGYTSEEVTGLRVREVVQEATMIFGGYSKGKEDLPRVFQISIARFSRELPGPGEPLSFLVAIHEEGTGITWQQNITVEPDTERYFLDTTETLYRRGLGYGGGTPESALAAVNELGRRLWATFLGDAGAAYLADSRPNALLLDVDETTLNLPWELMARNGDPLALEFPFGRIVRTRARPRSGRDPLQEDAEARILAIANPTTDLAAAEREVAAIAALAGDHGKFKIAVDVLARGDATRANFLARLTRGDCDIVHFAGHAGFDPTEPEASALRLADGFVTADELLALDWKAPPYLVLNSACESGRAAGGARLVSDQGQANGLAAAFLACGAAAYAGYFWPVTDHGALQFTETFYPALFGMENVGLAFMEARRRTVLDLAQAGDFSGFSAVLFGDAASGKRRDLATAA